MRNLVFFTFLLSLVCCGTKTAQKSVYRYVENKVIPIRIVFLVDKESYTYKFKFFNKSQDTLEIVKPQPYLPYSHFTRITQDGMIANGRCIITHMSGIEMIELPPNKEVTIDGAVGLKEYFCQFNDNDLLAFIYTGSYERNNGNGGLLCFDIQPVPFNKIDSIIIDKVLF